MASIGLDLDLHDAQALLSGRGRRAQATRRILRASIEAQTVGVTVRVGQIWERNASGARVSIDGIAIDGERLVIDANRFTRDGRPGKNKRMARHQFGFRHDDQYRLVSEPPREGLWTRILLGCAGQRVLFAEVRELVGHMQEQWSALRVIGVGDVPEAHRVLPRVDVVNLVALELNLPRALLAQALATAQAWQERSHNARCVAVQDLSAARK